MIEASATLTPLVAVLAGGRGRRMGSAKPLAEFDGAPLIARPLAAASAAGLDAVVVAKPGSRLPALTVPVWLEPAEPTHPLLGIVTALERAERPIVAIACDMPFVPAALLARLAAGPEAAVRAGGRVQPFPARYEPAALPALRAALAREAPLHELVSGPVLEEGELAAFGDPEHVVMSIDTPDELAAARR